MSDPHDRIELSTKRKRLLMSANVYTIESLLVGKTYKSRTLTGEIISAEKSDVWYKDCESYRVQVRPHYSAPLNLKDTYRILAVRIGD
jgi:hypothetical protein